VIGRGIVRSRAVEAINRRMVHEAANAGGRIVDVAYCPHRPEDRCSCRKPQPGLILGLATAYGVDLAKSVVIGDALTDVEAGRAAGCESILVLTGRGSDEAAGAAAVGPVGFSVAASLSHAVQAVLERSAVASRAEVESL
jgi:D-glycero-D-manno-heptose 1,7-bisphosphate phosphatase